MSEKRVRQIERGIDRIKEELKGIGPMRPGSLTRQYKDRQHKAGGSDLLISVVRSLPAGTMCLWEFLWFARDLSATASPCGSEEEVVPSTFGFLALGRKKVPPCHKHYYRSSPTGPPPSTT